MAPKRKGVQEGIAASLAKAQAATSTKKLAPVETTAASVRTVPHVYVEELVKTYGSYTDERGSKESQLERAAECRNNPVAATAPTPATAGPPSASTSIDLDDSDPTALHAAALVASRWQKKAAYCVNTMAAWAGSHVALQSNLQEKLAAIMLNHRLHPDPLLSLRAYQLLLKNLQRHPPVKAVPLSEGQPYMLEVNEQCWHPLQSSAEKLPVAKLVLADSANSKESFASAAAFVVFQDLVNNAVLMVTGNENSSNITHREPSGAKASQGKALLLLYLVQLLQADCNTRLAVFEQHMHSAAVGNLSFEEVEDIRRRAATALQHSLLYRIMETDMAWTDNTDDRKGRHRLVRDLVLLVTSNLDMTADIIAPATPAPATAAAANRNSIPAPSVAAAVPAAAQVVQPASPPELVSAARQLLLLMLDLYSNCEAAGVYGGGSRLHSKRSGDKDSDRCWLDIVLMKAIGALGTGHMLQNLRGDNAGPAALERLLQFLPAVHRVRLAALSVAVSIHRGHDPNPQAVDPLVAMFTYYDVKGRGNVDPGPEFVKSSALDIVRALTERQWVVKELLGGKEACALLLLSSLVPAALTGKQLHSATEQQQFKELMKPLLESVVSRSKAGLARECSVGAGYSEVLFAVGSALQLLGA